MSARTSFGRPAVVVSWALAAVIASTIVWWAVALIGGERGAARASVLSESAVSALASQPMPTATSRGGARMPGPDAVLAPSVPADAPTTAASPPSTDPSAAQEPGPAATNPAPAAGTDAAPAPAAVAPPAAAGTERSTEDRTSDAAEVARTWSVTGGELAVTCRGARIELLYATPRDGWSVHVGSPGPESVEVTFRRTGTQSSAHAACEGGTPKLEASHDDDD